MTLLDRPSSNAAAVTSHLKSTTYRGLAPGVKLLVLGAVHGNEICGTHAILEILQEIDSGHIDIKRGSVTFIPIANPLAYQRKQRVGDRNLNRNMAPTAIAQDFEDRVANVLCPLLDAHDVLLDLHSFHTGGAPFVMVGPANNQGELEPFSRAAEELQLALHTGPYRLVEGWLETYARGVQRRIDAAQTHANNRSLSLVTNPNYGVGTTEYMRSRGGYAVTLECGQHDDPQAVQVAKDAILQTLSLLGLSDLPLTPVPMERDILRLVDVTDREHADDQFVREWRSFDALHTDQVIGVRHDGTQVKSPRDGFIVFPNPRAQAGQEWFYFAEQRNGKL